MFQAMRRIVDDLVNHYAGESVFERSIRQSFLGMLMKILHVQVDDCKCLSMMMSGCLSQKLLMCYMISQS